MICPSLHAAKSSPARYAPTGPRCSGGGTAPSDTPPVAASRPDVLPAPACRCNAPKTIRVAAMGDSALTVTPSGVSWPICQVSAATARLAQL